MTGRIESIDPDAAEITFAYGPPSDGGGRVFASRDNDQEKKTGRVKKIKRNFQFSVSLLL
jgi:hypothetical protein